MDNCPEAKEVYMPQRHRDAYPREFKRKLVELVLAGRSPEELADVCHGPAGPWQFRFPVPGKRKL